MESKKKKWGMAAIKMQTYRMDLRTWGGGRVSWDEVREWHGHIYTTKCSRIAQGDQLGACVHLEGWDKDGGRETQEGGDMGMYVCV